METVKVIKLNKALKKKGFKFCNVCGKVKKLEEFSFLNQVKGYRCFNCKQCHSMQQAEYRKKHKAKRREYDKAYYRQYTKQWDIFSAMEKVCHGEKLSRKDLVNVNKVLKKLGRKYCNSCCRVRLLDDFAWQNKKKGIRQGICRKCHHAYMKVYRSKQDE